MHQSKKQTDLSILDFRIEYAGNLSKNLQSDILRFPEQRELLEEAINDIDSGKMKLIKLKTLEENGK